MLSRVFGRVLAPLGRVGGAIVHRASGHARMQLFAGQMHGLRRLATEAVSLANLRPAPGSRKLVRLSSGDCSLDGPTKQHCRR